LKFTSGDRYKIRFSRIYDGTDQHNAQEFTMVQINTMQPTELKETETGLRSQHSF